MAIAKMNRLHLIALQNDREALLAKLVHLGCVHLDEPEAPEELPFADVAEDAWYRDAVAWAVSEELVRGVSETAFAPDRTMTRQELAAVLWRYAGEPESDHSIDHHTDDHHVAGYAEDAVAWAVEHGIKGGYPDGTLRPNNTASRAHVAAMTTRFVDHIA